MGWNGSGAVTRTDGTRTGSTVWTQARDASVKINSSDADTHDQDLADAIEECWNISTGENSPSVDLDMNSKRLTDVGAPTARTDAMRPADLQDNTHVVIESISGADTITGSVTPSITAYSTNSKFLFQAASDNTTGATMNINGVGATLIKRPDGSTNLHALDLRAGYWYEIVYNGTYWVLLNPSSTAYYSLTVEAESNNSGTYNPFDEDSYSSYSYSDNVTSSSVTYVSSTGTFGFPSAGIYAINVSLVLKGSVSLTSTCTINMLDNGVNFYAHPRSLKAGVEDSSSLSVLGNFSKDQSFTMTIAVSAETVAVMPGTCISMYRVA